MYPSTVHDDTQKNRGVGGRKKTFVSVGNILEKQLCRKVLSGSDIS